MTWLTAIAGVVFGAVAAYVAIRKNGREEQSASDVEADRTIELLREQNTLIKEQARQAEERHRAEKAEWLARERKLEERIDRLDTAYRGLVETVTKMRLCRKAPDCPNYESGSDTTI